MTKLTGTLDEWLADRHPSIARVGYTLHVIERSEKGTQLRVHERGSPVTPFGIARLHEGVLRGLTADQMMATLQLPIPSPDPYWQPYWNELAANGADLGSTVITVQDPDGSKKPGVVVKLLGGESDPSRTRICGDHGEAAFRDVPTGTYQAVAGSEGATDSTSSKKVGVTVARGVDGEALITLA